MTVAAGKAKKSKKPSATRVQKAAKLIRKAERLEATVALVVGQQPVARVSSRPGMRRTVMDKTADWGAILIFCLRTLLM